MANVDRPSGFRPLRHLGGGQIRTERLTIDPAYATAIGSGSLVVRTGTGKNIQLATTGGAAIGVLQGVKYTQADGQVVYRKDWPGATALKAGTVAEAICYTDPDIVYSAQHDGTPVATNFGNLFDATAESVDAYGNSTQEVDTSTNASGTTLQVLGLVDKPDNELGEFAEVEVIIAAGQLRAAI